MQREYQRYAAAISAKGEDLSGYSQLQAEQIAASRVRDLPLGWKAPTELFQRKGSLQPRPYP
jgi:hypothetical protein